MFGCLGRIGCLALLLIIGAAAWFTRAEWYPRLVGDRVDDAVVAEAVWSPVTAEASAAGRAKVARLARADGPGVVALRPAEVAGYVLEGAMRQLPHSADEVEAAVMDDRVYVRAVLRLRDLGAEVLGPMGGMLGDRDTLLLGGRFEVVRPEVGQFRVQEVKVGSFSLPQAVIPRLLRRLRQDAAPAEGIAEDALPLALPPGVADVRAGGGRVQVYREAQP